MCCTTAATTPTTIDTHANTHQPLATRLAEALLTPAAGVGCVSLRAGQLQFCQPACSLPQLAQGQLLEMVTELLRQEKQALQAAGIEKPLEYDPAREGEVDAGFSYVWNNGWVPGTLGTSLANGTNTVMRR
jgi:hypothetical protein